jgi:cytochrome c oxidase assembly protein subunit 15
MTKKDRKQIAVWLFVCCALIFSMVVLGGVTRLTGSGLSMVDWKPVTGIIPPLDEQAWQKEFSRYQQSPEYQNINIDMDLEGFKKIYWFEFAHRVLGRTIGLVFLVPFLYFLVRRKLDRSLVPKLAIMFALGGLQGLLGWYMVKSGLVDNPHVSQYRLTAHLVAAVAIYSYIFWVALGLLYEKSNPPAPEKNIPLNRFGLIVAVLVFITLVSGGFVAGTRAGHAYNTFPLMGGQWIPAGIVMLDPAYRNFFDNIATVQFDHRILAFITLLTILGFWVYTIRASSSRHIRLGAHLLILMAILQVAMGIGTLLLHVPVTLAAAHQAGALTLFTIVLFVNHALRRTC